MILFSFSCSTDDGDSQDSQIQINPPSWIQGTWLIENTVTNGSGFRFTTNDVILLQPALEISQRGQLEIFIGSGQDVSTNEEFSEDTYKLTSNFPAGQTTVFSFTRVSETEITWNAIGNGVYTKQ
ncbi:hypothetical protein [Dokdonia sp. Hel_I_63]|uniref:hypothetical protein n=1 Tax=Dokdonia sp. Hel_I_63 TaxID=1249996 RepID=UPI0011A108B6|nr:hypothetical protein [Dokdonia sp. Hel_I_63]